MDYGNFFGGDTLGGEEKFANAVAVHRALEKLTLPHREVLTLFFLQDLAIKEISAVLETSPGTVKSRIYYAKRALKILLENEGLT